MAKEPTIVDSILNIMQVKKVHCIKDDKGNVCDTIFDYPKGFPFSYKCPKCGSMLGIEFSPKHASYIALCEEKAEATLLK